MQSSPACSCAATQTRTASCLPSSRVAPSRRHAAVSSPGAASQPGLGRLPTMVALTRLLGDAGMGGGLSVFVRSVGARDGEAKGAAGCVEKDDGCDLAIAGQHLP